MQRHPLMEVSICRSKSLTSLSKSMAIEYQEYDIRVNCIMSDTIDKK